MSDVGMQGAFIAWHLLTQLNKTTLLARVWVLDWLEEGLAHLNDCF